MLHEFGPDSNSNWNNINAISSIQFKSSDIAHLSSLSSFSVMPCSDVQGLEACERRVVVCIDVQGACSNCSSAGIDIYSNNCCVFWLTTSIITWKLIVWFGNLLMSWSKQEAPVLIYFNIHHSASWAFTGTLYIRYTHSRVLPISGRTQCSAGHQILTCSDVHSVARYLTTLPRPACSAWSP